MGNGNEYLYSVHGKKIYTKFLLKAYWECDNAILHNNLLKDSFLIKWCLFSCCGIIARFEGHGHFY